MWSMNSRLKLTSLLFIYFCTHPVPQSTTQAGSRPAMVALLLSIYGEVYQAPDRDGEISEDCPKSLQPEWIAARTLPGTVEFFWCGVSRLQGATVTPSGRRLLLQHRNNYWFIFLSFTKYKVHIFLNSIVIIIIIILCAKHSWFAVTVVLKVTNLKNKIKRIVLDGLSFRDGMKTSVVRPSA